MRKRLFALGALGACVFAGAISATPAMAQARDGSFSCRASALRITSIEPFRAGDNPSTANDPLDASDPCEPGRAGVSDYAGPAGCYRFDNNPPGVDPNCTNPNRVGTGAIYATTEECSNNRVETTPPPNAPVTPDDCSSTPGHVDLQGKNATPAEGQGVKSRAGVANLYLTDGSSPAANFLHLSVVNSFAEVTCRRNAQGQLVPVWDGRSQVVFANVAGRLVVDLIPGLIPGLTRSSEPHLNKHATAGPFQFNGTFANHNEPGGVVGPNEGMAQPVDPISGEVNYTDADRFTPGDQPIFRITQRAVDFNNGTLVAGEATVDVTRTPCGPARPPGPRIVINKVTTPQPDNTAFNFSGPGANNYSLSHGGTAAFSSLTPGNYTVTEEDKAGYAESVSCDDPSGGTTTSGRTASIRLDGTETVTCTFTNTKDVPPVNGRITIVKDTVPNDPQNFRFRGSGTIGAFQLDDDNDPTLPRSRTFVVTPGAYTVVEGPQDGFRLTAINCTDPTGNSRGNTRTATAMIDVASGEHVTCTFVNRKADEPCRDDEDDDDGRDEDNDGRDDDDDGRDEDRVDADRDGRDDDDDGRDDDGDGRDEDRDLRDNDNDGRDDDGDGRDRDRDDEDEDGDDNDNDGDDRNGDDGDDNGDECDDDDRGVGDLDVQPDEFRPNDDNGEAAVAAANKRRGARVLYRLDRSSRVKFQVQRLKGKRYVTMKGSFTHRGRKGRNTFRYTGHLAGRKLAPGRYRMVATVRTKKGKVIGSVERTRFRILR